MNNLSAKRIFCLAVLLISLGVVNSQAGQLYDSDKGTTVSLARGEWLFIILTGNPTTGYIWESDYFDEKILVQGEWVYVPESDLVGSGGTFSFPFLALQTGKTIVRLCYRRPWERGKAPLEVYEVFINVQNR